MYYPLRYIEWSEQEERELGLIQEYPSVQQDELFLYKLVDSIKLNNRIWVHVSHETEDDKSHLIYVRPFAEELPAPYQKEMARVIAGQKDYPSRMVLEYWIWDGYQFVRRESGNSWMSALDIARVLLDHYRTEGDVTYELLYITLDADRQKVMIFMKEVNV
ncbi:hypothetical protein [Paenibacillus hunanensis]|uniref:Uncharacterized protein n=1 Tax=Paenibacillus hunanensis TaxID=539262 RepID=A0ABU1J7M1_9BACL|nr:hypothetical protein [Paenibacillus hunanensis]MCL9661480.1 hypothetical protein [Paenibacillus hunanensis]MDR6246537.1 hypothetical protein [Paenibacillus hunanensis]GGJ04117.1 hypothetical protein GCM10008022_11330 [Paenibacillus hunanensis]